jgi:hypothetical protein
MGCVKYKAQHVVLAVRIHPIQGFEQQDLMRLVARPRALTDRFLKPMCWTPETVFIWIYMSNRCSAVDTIGRFIIQAGHSDAESPYMNADNSTHSHALAPKLLLARKEAASTLSISLRSLDYLISQRRLHTRKIGGRILVPHEELVRFIRSDRSEPMVPRDHTA